MADITVLIMDNDRTVRTRCVQMLEGMGYGALAADSADLALEMLKSRQADVVLADVRTPGMGAAELLDFVSKNCPQVGVVVAAERGDVDKAERATRLGAFGYVLKPFRPQEIRQVLERLVEKQELTAENRLLREQLKTRDGLGGLVGTSSKMQAVYRLILKVAPKRHPALILGESGTGKELAARAVHVYGPWRDQPFVPVDCGALTPTLIESELFGHVRGAFTGATQSRRGLLAEAGAGTVFLDEITELPVELQTKLLRALQEREVKPLGSNQRTRLESRVIAATNQDVGAAIKRGALRRDLYFRLNVVSIRIPPLRDRKSDIPVLVHHFLDRYGGADLGVTGFSDEAIGRLMNYDWPGNVRELENCVQRALTLGSGPWLEVKDLPSSLLYRLGSAAKGQGVPTLKELERQAILEALEATGGDRLRAAKLLGIGKTTIYRKLKEYGLQEFSGGPHPA